MADDDDREDDEARKERARTARFYLDIIKDLIGGGVAAEGSRYTDRDRMPAPLGGPDTPRSRDRKLMALYALAQDVVRRLGEYVPPVMPDRPAMLPVSDLTIMTHQISARQKGERASPGDREVVTAFGLWRTELINAEAESGSRLRVLMSTHDSLRAVVERTGEGADVAARLKVHIAQHWDVEAPYPETSDRDKMITRVCRRTDLLSTWLMNGTRPPRSFASRPRSDWSGGGYGGGRGGRVFDPRGGQGTTEDDDFSDGDF